MEVHLAAGEVGDAVVLYYVFVSAGVPFLGVNAVEHAIQGVGSARQHRLHAPAAFRCLDLPRIPWADGHNSVCCADAALHTCTKDTNWSARGLARVNVACIICTAGLVLLLRCALLVSQG